jgi:hypothetical protein
VSEYQYYEFLAIDRPLDDAEQAEIRSLSTRASITATSFVNEYHWGDFKGSPDQLMRRYYDAHLYVANWGTHRIMFRLPRTLLDPTAIRDYLLDNQVTAHTTREFVVLDITNEDHNGEFDFDYGPAAWLSSLVGVRAELAAGDLRPLYLAWLAAYGTWERDEDVFDDDADDDLEPPVPPGLRTLTAPQRALAEFLRLDKDLLAVAAATSPASNEVAADPSALARWIARRPDTQRTAFWSVSCKARPRVYTPNCCVCSATTPLHRRPPRPAAQWLPCSTTQHVNARIGNVALPPPAPRRKRARRKTKPRHVHDGWTDSPTKARRHGIESIR